MATLCRAALGLATLGLATLGLPLAGPWAPPAAAEPARAITIGDSVMLGAEPCLARLGYEVDAMGSRQIGAGIQLARSAARSAGTLVVHLGTNGGVRTQDVDAFMAAVGPDRGVIWLTVQLPDDTDRYTFEESSNRVIRAVPRRFRNARVIDWNAISGRNPPYFWADGIHLTPQGCEAYARLVDEAVSDLTAGSRPVTAASGPDARAVARQAARVPTPR
jgi:hypothetical protein